MYQIYILRYFLLWYQALGDNAPVEVHRMFASLVPGLPEPCIQPTGSPLKTKPFDVAANVSHESGDFIMEDIMQHPNFSSAADNVKKVVVEQTSTGIIGKIANVSASIFHDTNALNPVQTVEIQPLLPAGTNERAVDNETKYFFEILLDGMATSVTKIQWRDRSHTKAMRCFAFLLEKFKLYYLPVICPQFNHKNSLYKPNLGKSQIYYLIGFTFLYPIKLTLMIIFRTASPAQHIGRRLCDLPRDAHKMGGELRPLHEEAGQRRRAAVIYDQHGVARAALGDAHPGRVHAPRGRDLFHCGTPVRLEQSLVTRFSIEHAASELRIRYGR